LAPLPFFLYAYQSQIIVLNKRKPIVFKIII